MYKKTITYIDYDDVERTEDFYFNMEVNEVTAFQASIPGGLSEYIQRIVQAKNTKEIIDVFENLIAVSYGEKSLDGRRFVKNEEVLNNFKQTRAYPALFMELATDDDAAAEFINGIMPKEDAKKAAVPAPTKKASK